MDTISQDRTDATELGRIYWHGPREKAARKLDRQRRAARGQSTPRLRTILLVQLDAIPMPEWARRKAIKGLTLTDSSVWLGRIAGRILEREDRNAGGNPRVTAVNYRPCRVCKRPRLGLDAEHRLELDRKWNGERIPCGPECAEIQAARAGRRSRNSIEKGQRNAERRTKE